LLHVRKGAFISLRHLCSLTIGLVLIILLASSSSRADADTSGIQQAVIAYLVNLGGTASDISFHGTQPISSGCPPSQRCLGDVYLVSTYGPDSGGEALVVQTDRCPNCYDVLTAGGGVMSVANIESYGVDPARAQSLYDQSVH